MTDLASLAANDPFKGFRDWTVRVRRGPSGEVILRLGDTEMVMAEIQADRLAMLLNSVSAAWRDDTGSQSL